MNHDGGDRFRLYRRRPSEIVDTTLRDGQQSLLLHDHPKFFLTQADMVALLPALILYGVKFFEVFSRVESPHEPEEFKALQAARECAEESSRRRTWAHARPTLGARPRRRNMPVLSAGLRIRPPWLNGICVHWGAILDPIAARRCDESDS